MSLSEQVTIMENSLRLAEDELQRIKGVICVNFVEYEGCKETTTPKIWSDLDSFNEQSVYSAVMEVFTHYVEANKK